MSIKRSIDEISKKHNDYQNIEKILDLLMFHLNNKNISITNNLITNNMVHPLKKYKKTNNEQLYGLDNISHIKLCASISSLFGPTVNETKINRVKIDETNYFSLTEIILKKENQIKNINFINYEKIKDKLLKYFTLMNIYNLNNETINLNINKFLTVNLTDNYKSIINIHKNLNIYNELSIKFEINKLNSNFIKKLLRLYSEYLFLSVDI